jgi:ATP-dependent exoDNAse (exonuclease V) beta subunit
MANKFLEQVKQCAKMAKAKGYLTEEMLNTEYARWLYTAVTRATERLYLVNFNDQFFE